MSYILALRRSSRAPALAALPHEKTQPLHRDEVLDLIEARWLAYPSASAEGSTSASYRGEPDLLELSFEFYLWTISDQRLKITVARVADDGYRVWLSKDGTYFAPGAG